MLGGGGGGGSNMIIGFILCTVLLSFEFSLICNYWWFCFCPVKCIRTYTFSSC